MVGGEGRAESGRRGRAENRAGKGELFRLGFLLLNGLSWALDYIIYLQITNLKANCFQNKNTKMKLNIKLNIILEIVKTAPNPKPIIIHHTKIKFNLNPFQIKTKMVLHNPLIHQPNPPST